MQLVDNQETLLERSDLVFVDAIGTGYSAAIAPHINQEFWGADRDAAAFRDFVQRYVAVNKRDSSLAVVNGAFTGSIGSYLAGEVHYTAKSAYVSFIDIANSWNFSHDGKGLPDTIPDLAAALAQNPAMKVLSLNGYFDLTTPYHQTELDLARRSDQGMCVAGAAGSVLLINKVVSTVIAVVFLQTVGRCGYGTAYFYGADCAVRYFLNPALLPPETKDMALEVMEASSAADRLVSGAASNVVAGQ